MTKCRTIAIFNQAGGVGKTTITMNLGYHLAAHSKKVLLVDMDPQASLTNFMGLEVTELKTTIYDALMAEDLEDIKVYSNIHGMDLAPSNITLSNAEQELVLAEQREIRLKEPLSRLENGYDFILIDCPPSLGILSYISLVAATHVLVPIQTQFKSLMGTDFLLSTVSKVKKRLNKNLKFAGFWPTMYSAGNVLDSRTLETITEQLSEVATIFTPLPRATALAEASEYGLPLALAPKKNKQILQIFDEVSTLIEDL